MEEWRLIPGVYGYEVSSIGRVRSIDRYILCKNGSKRKIKGTILKCGFHSKKWPYPQLRLGRKYNGIKVHDLVALAFIGPKPSGTYVCHNNNNPIDNRVENLRYDTPKSNQEDRKKHKTRLIRSLHPMAKLSEEDVKKIRNSIIRGEKQQTIANIYGVTQSEISHIKRGKLWSK